LSRAYISLFICFKIYNKKHYFLTLITAGCCTIVLSDTQSHLKADQQNILTV
jgi:hypothetical protein